MAKEILNSVRHVESSPYKARVSDSLRVSLLDTAHLAMVYVERERLRWMGIHADPKLKRHVGVKREATEYIRSALHDKALLERIIETHGKEPYIK